MWKMQDDGTAIEVPEEYAPSKGGSFLGGFGSMAKSYGQMVKEHPQLLLGYAAPGLDLLAGPMNALQGSVQAAGQTAAQSAAAGGSTVAGGGGAAAGSGAAGASPLLSTASKAGQLLTLGGKMLGNTSARNTESRVYGDQAQQEYDDALLARVREGDNQALIDLQRRKFLADDYQRNASNAVRGGALMGVQDLNVQAPAGIPMGSVTGGLRPSGIQGREQVGAAMQSQAMKDLLTPQAFSPQMAIPAPAKPTPPGLTEKATGLASSVLPTAATLLDLFRKSGRPASTSLLGNQENLTS